MIVFIIIFVIVLGIIYFISRFKNKKYDKFCEYVIVLGARILDDRTPCKTLEERLNCAIEYLNIYDKSKIVVTGGQGNDEVTSEASVMKNYFLIRGISPDRILVEDTSTNTFENLKNAKKILRYVDEILVISSNYHLFRAFFLAKRIGFNKVHLMGSDFISKVRKREILREVFAIIKSFFLDW